jgi:hypothetical protein
MSGAWSVGQGAAGLPGLAGALDRSVALALPVAARLEAG